MAQKETLYKAYLKYQQVTFDGIYLRVPKGEKAKIQQKAKEAGLPLNTFINEAIKEKMNKSK